MVTRGIYRSVVGLAGIVAGLVVSSAIWAGESEVVVEKDIVYFARSDIQLLLDIAREVPQAGPAPAVAERHNSRSRPGHAPFRVENGRKMC